MPLSTLRFAKLPIARAQALADRLEGYAAAVSIHETDERLGEWEVVAFFESREVAETALDLAGETGQWEALADRDWVADSLKGLHPVAAGRFFLHGSHDRQRRRHGGLSLEIDAGTAFGTGHHATTAGCLTALDALLKRVHPCRVLDLGCGTGVLALAAARAVRRPVLASDIDATAVAVARSNARRNAAAPLVRAVEAAGLKHPVLRKARPFDLIFANILAGPLVRLAGALGQALAPGGHLILSGLTHCQSRMVEAAYRNRRLVLLKRLTFGDWSVLVLTKTKRPPRGGRFGSRGARISGPTPCG